MILHAVRYPMARSAGTEQVSHCTNCGFETDDPSAWDRVDTPAFGELTRCPECGSTQVTILT